MRKAPDRRTKERTKTRWNRFVWGQYCGLTFDRFANENRDSPLHIETEHAWYQLQTPSSRYQSRFRYFFKPHRIARLDITSAKTHPNQSYEEFLDYFCDPILVSPFEDTDIFHEVSDLAILMYLSRHYSDTGFAHKSHIGRMGRWCSPALYTLPSISHLLTPCPLVGNLDLAVLRADGPRCASTR
jgi:hypothetical protein